MAEDIAHYLASADEELCLARTSSSELGRTIHRDFAAVYLRRVAVLRARAASPVTGGERGGAEAALFSTPAL